MIIRTTLALEISEYDKRLLGYTASMSYNYAQLCVIADPSSLLPIQMLIGGDMINLDSVASVVIHKKDDEGDNITIDLYPKEPSYITAIMEGVLNYHPEFRQTIEDIREQPGNEELRKSLEASGKLDDETALRCKFIRLVMPDVDKDRHDLLIKLVKAYRDALTLKFDAIKAKTEARLVPLFIGVPKEEVDAVNDKLDQTYKYYVDIADKLTEEKQQQIEDAYQEHIKLHPEDAVSKQIQKPAEEPPTPDAEEEPRRQETTAAQEFDNKRMKLDW